MSDISLGEYRVGMAFNPSGDVNVWHVKALAAGFIDFLEKWRPDDASPEVHRLVREAQHRIEEAAMWAVKAVTKRKRDDV